MLSDPLEGLWGLQQGRGPARDPTGRSGTGERLHCPPPGGKKARTTRGGYSPSQCSILVLPGTPQVPHPALLAPASPGTPARLGDFWGVLGSSSPACCLLGVPSSGRCPGACSGGKQSVLFSSPGPLNCANNPPAGPLVFHFWGEERRLFLGVSGGPWGPFGAGDLNPGWLQARQTLQPNCPAAPIHAFPSLPASHPHLLSSYLLDTSHLSRHLGMSRPGVQAREGGSRARRERQHQPHPLSPVCWQRRSQFRTCWIFHFVWVSPCSARRGRGHTP